MIFLHISSWTLGFPHCLTNILSFTAKLAPDTTDETRAFLKYIYNSADAYGLDTKCMAAPAMPETAPVAVVKSIAMPMLIYTMSKNDFLQKSDLPSNFLFFNTIPVVAFTPLSPVGQVNFQQLFTPCATEIRVPVAAPYTSYVDATFPYRATNTVINAGPLIPYIPKFLAS